MLTTICIISFCVFIILVISLICTYKQVDNYQNTKQNKNQTIQKLVRGVARWSNASQQDKSPLIAVLHSNYAAGYLWALDEIASEQEIKEATGIDFHQLTNIVTNYQDQALKKAVEICPAYTSDLDPYLSKLGGES